MWQASASVLLLERILAADEAQWEELLSAAAVGGDASELALKNELQKRMEALVLKLPSGSYAQRVQVLHPQAHPIP